MNSTGELTVRALCTIIPKSIAIVFGLCFIEDLLGFEMHRVLLLCHGFDCRSHSCLEQMCDTVHKH